MKSTDATAQIADAKAFSILERHARQQSPDRVLERQVDHDVPTEAAKIHNIGATRNRLMRIESWTTCRG